MKLIIIGMLVTLMALGTSCGQISQPVAEVAPQGTSDGIKVHGDWTVTVTNPDGTVDAVHEFENELQSGGEEGLVQLLSGEKTVVTGLSTIYPQGWRLYFQSWSGAIECDEGHYSAGLTLLTPDVITEIDGDKSSLSVVATCTTSMLHDGTADLNEVEMIELYRVGTMVLLSDTSNSASTFFSSHVLNPYINVQKNQRLGLTVRFTFD